MYENNFYRGCISFAMLEMVPTAGTPYSVLKIGSLSIVEAGVLFQIDFPHVNWSIDTQVGLDNFS